MDMGHPYHSTVPSHRYHPLVGSSDADIEEAFIVAIDEQHVALPKLYGAPAYARPPRPAEDVARPFDPDDLPIEAVQTEEERELVASLPAGAYLAGGARDAGGVDPAPSLRPSLLSLRALAGRFRGQTES